MIRYFIPWNDSKNLGVSYNEHMQTLPDDGWACFVDADAMFLQPFFGLQVAEYVNTYPECRLFTAKTNRIGNTLQRVGDIGDDIATHRKVAEDMKGDTSITRLNEHHQDLSGVIIVVAKSLWQELGGFMENGMLGIDSDFCQRAKAADEPVYIMNGVYVYHWYRGGGTDKGHLL